MSENILFAVLFLVLHVINILFLFLFWNLHSRIKLISDALIGQNNPEYFKYLKSKLQELK